MIKVDVNFMTRVLTRNVFRIYFPSFGGAVDELRDGVGMK